MTIPEIVGMSGLGLALVTLVLNLFDRNKSRIKALREEWEATDDKLSEEIDGIETLLHSMQADLQVVKSQISVFWRGVAFNSAALLHSPHTPEFDRLIEMFLQDLLTAAELVIFKEQLHGVALNVAETVFRRYLANEVLLALYMQERFPEVSAERIPYLELMLRTSGALKPREGF